MSQAGKQTFERLGQDGLARVLGDLLDHGRLVRLANACGLRYPGMRTQSQKRERLIADLAERAMQQEAAALAIRRVLDKETRAAARDWAHLDAGERERRLEDADFLRQNGRLGLHLFLLLAREPEEESPERLAACDRLLRLVTDARDAAAPLQPSASRDETRLRKRIAELEKKVQHLEGQMLKSREAERTIKRDLIQRKGELAESRMLVERLRRELAESQEAARRATTAPANGTAVEPLDELSRLVRKLAGEHRRLAHRLEKVGTEASEGPRPELPVQIDPAVLSPLEQGLDGLRKEMATQRREVKREVERQSAALDELRATLERREDHAPVALRARRSRSKSEPDRVGVFIDVQNMYYGARRLKGKLDFDALLQAAVRDRRLIQATAYVVESKEIDQSGFIALLEQRAIEVRRKTLQIRADGSMKGDWDMELALDILDATPRLDVVVLVSGDGDFTSLVKRVKAMGPRVEVVGFPRTTAKSLVEAADEFHPLDRRFMIHPPRAKGRPHEIDVAADTSAADDTEVEPEPRPVATG